jgi:hypothetical protein
VLSAARHEAAMLSRISEGWEVLLGTWVSRVRLAAQRPTVPGVRECRERGQGFVVCWFLDTASSSEVSNIDSLFLADDALGLAS